MHERILAGFGLGLLTVMFLLSAIALPSLPENIDIHWNAQGEANDAWDKTTGVFFIPALSLGIFALFLVLPKIDPKKENYKKFGQWYYGLIIIFIAYMFGVQGLILLWNLGYQFSIGPIISLFIGLLFVFLGFMLKHVKQNWFVGIRTPWTLQSETVWNKTHQKAGKFFITSGLIMCVGFFAGQYFLWLILVPLFISIVYVFVYSYTEYKKEQH